MTEEIYFLTTVVYSLEFPHDLSRMMGDEESESGGGDDVILE